MSSISLDNVSRSWGPVEAVKNVSFSVEAGSFTVLLGPSGCGKSTLLRMLCGLEAVSKGSIKIGDRDVTNTEPADRGVSMVFQSYALFPHLSVKENIQFGLKVRRVPLAEREKKLHEAAEIVGLTHLLDRRPSKLSGGQRQRVALARTIVSEKSVCLMDEPLSNLDAKLRSEMRDQIRNLQRQLGLTVVYVTHDQIEAMSMADQIILLELGKIVQIGTPDRLYNQPANIFAAQFVGVPPMNILQLNDISKEAFDCIASSCAIPVHSATAIGVRPEHISISQNGVAADVYAVDYFGGESVIKTRVCGNDIFVRAAGQPRIRSGDSVHLSWHLNDTHMFDSQDQNISIETTDFR